MRKFIRTLLTRKEEPVLPKDDIKKINICGGVLKINHTHAQKVKEARHG